jgi:hypothetical protein
MVSLTCWLLRVLHDGVGGDLFAVEVDCRLLWLAVPGTGATFGRY